MVKKKKLLPSKQLLESLSDPGKELSRERSAISFYENWIGQQHVRLAGIKKSLKMIIRHLPRETSPVEMDWVPLSSINASKESDHEPWPDYFSRQEEVVEHFFETGDIMAIPKEKPLFLHNVVNDAKALHVLQQHTDLLLTLVSHDYLANDRGAYANFIDYAVNMLTSVLNFVLGWSRPSMQIMEMMPVYKSGLAYLKNQGEFSKRALSERGYFVAERNRNIMEEAAAIRSSEGGNISNSKIAKKIYSQKKFVTFYDELLSSREIRKIIAKKSPH